MAATVVIVDGVWHRAWCFDRITPLPKSAGVPAAAPDLPGRGADPGPLADLHRDASRVTTLLGDLATQAGGR